MPPELVIALYRPHEGKAEALLEIVKRHEPALRKQKLVTDRPFVLMRASDGTLVEVFEWATADAADAAHTDPLVGPLWGEMMAVADFPVLADLPEVTRRFPHFEPVGAGPARPA